MLVNDLDTKGPVSVDIIRELAHPKNLSAGRETMVPPRLLYGLVPQCLLDTYRFWQDESVAPYGEPASPAMRGYRRLRGYPLDEDGEHIILIEMRGSGSWQHFVSPDARHPKLTLTLALTLTLILTLTLTRSY